MKKLYLVITVLILTVNIWAQAPQKMSYQTVIRDASNTLIASTTVGIRISVLQGSASGSAVFVETHAPTTNLNGLASMEIGTGTPVTGTMAGIDWSAGPYFIKTETDPSGGTSYSIIGSTELKSVPYALYADNAITYTGGAGISITGNVIANSAPDQTVSITGVGGTSITGSYPNFSVSSSAVPKIIAGTSSGGFTPTIINGGGFTVAHISTGNYTITFNTPFATIPSAVASIYNYGNFSAQIEVNSVTTSTFKIKTYLTTTGPGVNPVNNMAFSFIVIGN